MSLNRKGKEGNIDRLREIKINEDEPVRIQQRNRQRLSKMRYVSKFGGVLVFSLKNGSKFLNSCPLAEGNYKLCLKDRMSIQCKGNPELHFFCLVTSEPLVRVQRAHN